MLSSGTEHRPLTCPASGSTVSSQPTAEEVAVMRSPSGASKTPLSVLFPAFPSTRSSWGAADRTARRTVASMGSGVAAGAKRYVGVASRGTKVLTRGRDLADAPLDQEIQGPVEDHPDLVPESHQLGEVEAPPDEPGQLARQPDSEQIDGSEVLA